MTITLSPMTDVRLDAEGFFVDPDQWAEDMVPDIARRVGLGTLTDEHWRVIRFMREQWRTTGSGPSVRALSKTSGVPIKRLYELFPTGPAKTAAKLAGIPKPRGCI
jgi:dissimilatory sulfite reductase related protein